MKRTVFVILVALLLLVPAAAASASVPQPFVMEKVFPSTVYPTENVCDIVVAPAQFPQLSGGTIWYYDRYASATKEIARVEIRPGDGSGDRLYGQVRWLGAYGLFTFGQGTGAFAGVHATGRVDAVDSGDWGVRFRLTGTIHIDPV